MKTSGRPEPLSVTLMAVCLECAPQVPDPLAGQGARRRLPLHREEPGGRYNASDHGSSSGL